MNCAKANIERCGYCRNIVRFEYIDLNPKEQQCVLNWYKNIFEDESRFEAWLEPTRHNLWFHAALIAFPDVGWANKMSKVLLLL